MGKLLPDTPEIRSATASGEFNELLDVIEGDFLAWKKVERGLVQMATSNHENIIDISSAASMKVFDDAGKNVSLQVDTIQQTVTAYPYVLAKDFTLEDAFSELLQTTFSIEVTPAEILVTNGTYAATRNIVRAFSGDIVLVPEFMNQAQKASITAMGKEVVEIPMLVPEWKLDVDAFAQLLTKYQGRIACTYIHHLMSARLDESYFTQIASLLETAGVVAVIDIDIIGTVHTDVYEPTLPLKIKSLRKQAIFLFTLSKEFGAPGVRTGFAVGPADRITQVRLFLQRSLDMVPPTSRAIALEIIKQYDLAAAVKILQARMKVLVNGLQSLELEASLPNIGVNLTIHVPRDWEKTTKVLPDHLFTYFCLTRAGVVLRPGSIYGHRLNHFVRFVVGQPESVIQEMIDRLRTAGVHGSMLLPDGLEAEYQEVIESYRTKK